MFFELVKVEVKKIIYDMKTLMILIIMPVVLMSILGASLQGMFGDNGAATRINIAVVKEYDVEYETNKFLSVMPDTKQTDLEDMSLEQIFMNDFLGNEELEEILDVTVVSMVEAEELLTTNEISAIIVLPKNFVYNGYVNLMTINRNILTIDVIKNPDQMYYGDIVESIISSFTGQLNSGKAQITILVQQLLDLEMTDEMIEAVIDQDRVTTETNITEKSTNARESISSFQYYAAAIMTMFLLYAAGIGGKSMLSDKNSYVLARLTAGGVPLMMIALANLVKIALIVVIQSVVMIIYSSFILGVNWGDIQLVILGTVMGGFAVGGMGIFISILTLVTGKYTVANLFENVIVYAMALLGGSYIPIEILPKALRDLNFVSINGHVLKIYINGMYNLNITESMDPLYSLLIFGFMFSFLGFIILILTRKKVDVC